LKYYFFDSCAIACYYCEDVGSSIIRQLVDSGNGLIISSLSSLEGISALTNLRNGQHHGFNDSEYRKAVNAFQVDLTNKFLQLKIEDPHYTIALDLIKKYNIGTADALIIATSLHLSDTIANDGHKVFFITSDGKAFKAANAEGQDRDYYSAFHFWQCRCRECGNTFKVQKHANEKIVCPTCGRVICERCQIQNCTNTYIANL